MYAVSKAMAPYKAGLPIKFSAFNNSFGLKFCFKKLAVPAIILFIKLVLALGYAPIPFLSSSVI